MPEPSLSPRRPSTPRPGARPRAATRSATSLLGVGALTLGLATVGSLAAPTAGAGPCSTMFGNFGSLRENATGAGMGTGSAGSLTSGSAGSIGTDRGDPLITQLETGSLGNALSGSLDTATGSVYGAPPWATGEQGTVPVLDGPTRFLQLVTGPTSPAETVSRYGVGGTDLGIMWDDGAQPGKVLMAFGDTMGDCSVPGNQWRSNVLFRSSDRELADGLTVDSAAMGSDGLAKSIVPRSGLPGETTIIPTAGISVNGVQYLRYMSVSHWDTPGSWRTNYSGLAYSTDDGENWSTVPSMSRAITDTVPRGAGAPPIDEAWRGAQMSSFLRADGYLYEYLTASGRSGYPILARVPEKGSPGAADLPAATSGGVLDRSAYRYWTGSTWSESIADAGAVMPGPASEMSVQWNEHLHRYVSMYSSGATAVLLRTAERPEGPWSTPVPLIDYSVIPGAYGGFMHPWSQGGSLYYLVTTWNAYNVFLVRTDLDALGLTGDGRLRAAAEPAAPAGGATRVVRSIPVDQLDGDMIPQR